MIHRARFHLAWLPRVCIAALAAAFLLPARAGADPIEERERIYEGTEILRRIFHKRKFEAIEQFDDLKGDEKNSIVFFLGSSGIDSIPGGLDDFVRAGGAVMIATNNPVGSRDARRQLAALTGLSVAGEPVVFPSEFHDTNELCYQGKAHCPWLVPLDPTGDAFHLFVKPGTGETLRVATNEPSYLRSPRNELLRNVEVLACLPPGGTIEGNRGRFQENTQLTLVGGVVEKGRLLLLANHRLFLNRMMVPRDTYNVEFALNCLSMLEEREGGRRSKLLFVEFGNINTKFDVPIRELPDLPDNLPELFAAGLLELGRRLPLLQAHLARAEEKDEFHSGLWRLLAAKGITGPDVLRWTFFIGSGLFAFYGLMRIFGPGRHRVDASTPLLPRVIEKHLPAGSLFERRRQAMLDNNNLWEAARDRARTVLLEAGVPEPRTGDHPPRVRSNGRMWQRWRTSRRVLRLWRLAFDPTPQLVPKSAWDIITRELAELTAALASGAVRLA